MPSSGFKSLIQSLMFVASDSQRAYDGQANARYSPGYHRNSALTHNNSPLQIQIEQDRAQQQAVDNERKQPDTFDQGEEIMDAKISGNA